MDTAQTTGAAAPPTGPGGHLDPVDRRRDRVRRVVAFSVTGVLLVALSGCSGDPALTPVEAAQAQVTAKEEALATAESEATATAAAFCEASATYITALDRYGDVLNETAPTVGDVKDAGRTSRHLVRTRRRRARPPSAPGNRSPRPSRTSPTPRPPWPQPRLHHQARHRPKPRPARCPAQLP